jgi:hypothetical protein
MKTKKQISKLVASATLALAAMAPVYGQSNLGASCGCPPVASRPTVLLTSLSGYTAISGTYGGELTTGASLSCANNYIIDKKIYIPAGQTLAIEPGTVLKGRVAATAAEATALVIERGGKIIANGTEDCQIVFTAEADPLNGTYAISNKGIWGGVVLLGKATNNLTLAANGPFNPTTGGKIAVADGLGTVEGFASSNTQDQYGVNLSVAGQSFDDNDNSGIMKYVSIRHAGAIFTLGGEINGLTLASVGRGTTIENIEIVSCADDNIEIFGGTVNLKYITTLFGNDDMFDYDQGWKGKAQFFFGMKTDLTASADSDNGIEADSDDQASNTLPKSHPVMYNFTIMGNGKTAGTSDNRGVAGVNFKEGTEGELYNSVFANFQNGINLQKTISGTRAANSESYHNWATTGGNASESLKIKCNTLVGMAKAFTTNASSVPSVGTAPLASDSVQFITTDKNVIVAGNTLPGFSYTFAVNNTTNAFSLKNDVVPNPSLSVAGCPTAPNDGFFTPANYRGAFSSEAGKNWLSDWTYAKMLGTTQGVSACPTDMDADGDTDIADFLIFAPAFNTSCN